MKLAFRIFVLSVVVAGAAAAAVTPKTTPVVPSHQSATASMPIPGCGPYICPPNPNNGN
jgi:P pilus assembly chaperone PapD